MESWPPTSTELFLDRSAVRANLEKTRALLERRGLDALVVTSADSHLNEYTPRADNQRYFLSGFTGSTALMLVPRVGRAKLFVDGRYHIQADLQVDPADVEVVKVPLSNYISAALYDAAKAFAKVGYAPDRVSKAMEEALKGAAKDATPLEPGELDQTIGIAEPAHTKPLSVIPPGISGRSIKQKLEAVFATIAEPEKTVLLLTALDDIAWMTDARGYHFAYQSSFAARGFAVNDAVHVALAPALLERHRPPAVESVHWHVEPIEALLARSEYDAVTTVLYDSGATTAAVLRRLAAARPNWTLVAQSSPVVAVRAVKTPEELRHLEAINERSSRAVANTIRWVRRQLATGARVSETGFYEAANGYYAAEGARDLSFHTISSIGADTAIIHFSEPKDDVVATPDDLMLLDSGALYEGGLSTDITRAFLAGGRRGQAAAKAKEIYTLTLKGLLNAATAIFPSGTRGSFLDALARQPLYQGGYDFAHGTGHGVGIHVHEPGVSLGPTSTLAIKAGHVSSIEPGIYLGGFGGVRLENVYVYEPVPERPGFLRPRALNFVAFDRSLIDESILEPRERAALEAYMAECVRRGTDYNDA